MPNYSDSLNVLSRNSMRLLNAIKQAGILDRYNDAVADVKQKFEVASHLPEATQAAARGAEFGHRVAPGLVGGALAGGGLGLLADPGYDEEGRRRSRLARILAGTLGGAAIGGVGAAAFPGVASYGAELGAKHEFNKVMKPLLHPATNS